MSDEYISGEEHQNIKKSHSSSKKTRVTISVNHLILVAIVVAACLISFLGGVVYQKHHNPVSTATSLTTSGNASGFRGKGGYGRRLGSFGQVTSVSSSSITISDMRTGSTMTYSVTSTTAVTDNGQTSSISDIQTGDTVLVTTSSSSSTVATRILVNPSFGGGSSSTPSQPPTGSQTSN